MTIDSWPSTVLGTAVPEAAIDENRNLAPSEHNVWTDEFSSDSDRVILTEAIAESVQRRTKRDFRDCVSAPDGRHVAGPTWRRHVIDISRRGFIAFACHIANLRPTGGLSEQCVMMTVESNLRSIEDGDTHGEHT